MGKSGGGYHKGTKYEEERRKRRDNIINNEQKNIVVIYIEKIKEKFNNNEIDMKLPYWLLVSFFSVVVVYSIIMICKESL